MLIAELKGKLSLKEWVSEDFLTSSVFSVFQYIGGEWIHRFLRKAKNLDDQHIRVSSDPATFEFWPWLKTDAVQGRGVQPDVVVSVGQARFVIEAKYLSGKSRVGFTAGPLEGETMVVDPPADQLAREYDAAAKNFIVPAHPSVEANDFALIYLTADQTLPIDSLEESIVAIGRLDPTQRMEARARVFWLSWFDAPPLLQRYIDAEREGSPGRLICEDLLRFLRRRELTSFSGFDFASIETLPPASVFPEGIFFQPNR